MRRVFNYERPQTFSDEQQKILEAFESLGSSVVDDNTGEVLAERPNWFYANDRVGAATFEEEAGDPVVINFDKSRDLKARALALVGRNSVASLFNDDVDEDDEDRLVDTIDEASDLEVDEFNQAMSRTPYAIGEDGLAQFERVLAQNKQDLKNLRKFMSVKDSFSEAFKDNENFEKLMSLSADQLQSLIAGAASNQTTTQQPSGDAAQTDTPPKD